MHERGISFLVSSGLLLAGFRPGPMHRAGGRKRLTSYSLERPSPTRVGAAFGIRDRDRDRVVGRTGSVGLG